MKEQPTIAIIGLGFVGGAMFKSFSEKGVNVYGYDKYFTDAKRGAVIQLKGGGQNEKLTIISDHNMRSWFRDLFLDDG